MTSNELSLESGNEPEADATEQLAFTDRLRNAGSATMRLAQTAIVAAELTPANEAVRFGAFGYALYETGSPVAAAAAMAVTTIAVEGSAALATAGLIDSDRGQKVQQWIDRKTGGKLRRSDKQDTRISPPVEAGIALFIGTPAVLAAHQMEDPTRTLKQNRVRGMVVSTAMGGYFAVESFAAAHLTEPIGNPTAATAVYMAGTIGATAGVSWIYNKFKARRRNRNQEK